MSTPTTIRLLRSALFGWGAAFLALALGLAALPLFDLLGYEFCLAFTLPATLSGAHLAGRLVMGRRPAAPPSEHIQADAHPFRYLLYLFLQASFALLSLLLVPLLVICTNALRVRNCNFGAGVAWFCLLPVLSGLLGCVVGLVSALIAPKKWALPISYASIGACLLMGLYRFYAAPPIFAYDPFIGYFAGSLYDEAVRPRLPLFFSRLYQAASALLALCASALFLDGGQLRLRGRSARGRAPLAAFSLLLLGLVGGLFLHRAALGFAIGATDIAGVLGAERRTRHFVLHYSKSGPFAKDIDLYARDHEFRYRELRALFGSEPNGPIHSFLFDTVAQKEALMGAAHTYITKPWRREIYLQYESWPQAVLKHELAHVFAGAFGDPIFGLARRGARFNIGLIEGIAEAAAWHASPLSPHQSVKALRLAGRRPRLDRALRLGGFFDLGPASAYAVTGSFCRFLLDTRGAERLRALYVSGGDSSDFVRIYGVSLSTLEAEWSQLVDAVPLSSEEDAEGKRYLFQPSIFHRACAHELALRREEAQIALERGDRDGARRLLESLCRAEPDEPAYLEALMHALHNEPTEMAKLASRLLTHPNANDAQRASADQLLGDLAWGANRRTEAAQRYRAARALRIDAPTWRLLRVKSILVETDLGRLAEPLRRIFTSVSGERESALDIFYLSEVTRAQPEIGLFHYLFARQLTLRSRPEEASIELKNALALGLPDQEFADEAARLLGISYFRQNEFSEAIHTFEKLSHSAGTESLRLDAADWAARSRYFQSSESSR
jgi:hypothetical protein